MNPRVAAVVVAALLAMACQDNESRALPLATEANGAPEARELWTIGALGGSAAEQFGDVGAVVSDSAGRVFVLDRQTQEVRVFSSDGEFQRRIGSRGQGPGEMVRAEGMVLDPLGRLWVMEPGRMRYSVFSADGTFLQTERRVATGMAYPWMGAFTLAGDLIDWGVNVFPADEESRTRRVTLSAIRRALGSAAVDTLARVGYERSLSRAGHPLPFAPTAQPYVDSHGVVWLAQNAGEYRIVGIGGEADTVAVLERDADAARTTEAEIDSVIALGVSLPTAERILPEELPSRKPIIRQIFGDGSRWVMVVFEEENVEPGSAVDVWETSGKFIGRVNLPRAIALPYPLPWTDGSYLVFVWRDDLGASHVTKLMLDW